MSNFTCSICIYYEIDKDMCKQTGEIVGSFRANRTCCGVESWHVTRKNDVINTFSLKSSIAKFKSILKSSVNTIFLSNEDKRELLALIDTYSELKEKADVRAKLDNTHIQFVNHSHLEEE